jgi:hypothetical protein
MGSYKGPARGVSGSSALVPKLQMPQGTGHNARTFPLRHTKEHARLAGDRLSGAGASSATLEQEFDDVGRAAVAEKFSCPAKGLFFLAAMNMDEQGDQKRRRGAVPIGPFVPGGSVVDQGVDQPFDLGEGRVPAGAFLLIGLVESGQKLGL